MNILIIILSVLFAIVSGISKAICDLSEEGKIKGNPMYWIKKDSSINKWKNGDKMQGEKFWLSSSQLVWLTDAWHFFGLLERIGFIVTYTGLGLMVWQSSWYWFGLLLYPFSMLIFHIFYTYKILRK